MTVVAFTSLNGAPGVTTTACLVGATWPAERRVIVVESDPAGGDLAARFSLSSHRGWPTFLTAARRTAAGGGAGPSAPVDPHLQSLPGGLEVLVGTRALTADDWPGGDPPVGDRRPDDRPAAAVLAGWAGAGAASDVVVDLGRLHHLTAVRGGWLDLADLVVVVIGGDAASVLRVQEVRDRLVSRCGERLVVAVVRNGRYSGEEIEGFLGIPVVAELPYDPGAASVASGQRGGARRLARSGLVAATGRLARALVERSAPAAEPAADPGADSTAGPTTAPTAPPDGPDGRVPPTGAFERVAVPAATGWSDLPLSAEAASEGARNGSGVVR